MRNKNLLNLVLLLLCSCQSWAKFTPEQINSIKAVGEEITKLAQDNNVTVIAELDLEPIEFGVKESAYMKGIKARIIMTANPAAK